MATDFQKLARCLADMAVNKRNGGIEKRSYGFYDFLAAPYGKYVLGGLGGAGVGALLGALQPEEEKRQRNMLFYGGLGGLTGLGLAHALPTFANNNNNPTNPRLSAYESTVAAGNPGNFQAGRRQLEAQRSADKVPAAVEGALNELGNKAGITTISAATAAGAGGLAGLATNPSVERGHARRIDAAAAQQAAANRTAETARQKAVELADLNHQNAVNVNAATLEPQYRQIDRDVRRGAITPAEAAQREGLLAEQRLQTRQVADAAREAANKTIAEELKKQTAASAAAYQRAAGRANNSRYFKRLGYRAVPAAVAGYTAYQRGPEVAAWLQRALHDYVTK
ncbi:hypothetical protein EBZ39_02650 [bacterium]|nr:hypothetical protein [bacterium]